MRPSSHEAEHSQGRAHRVPYAHQESAFGAPSELPSGFKSLSITPTDGSGPPAPQMWCGCPTGELEQSFESCPDRRALAGCEDHPIHQNDRRWSLTDVAHSVIDRLVG
jgi:hypothetical protein